jgi:hypothetical protein
MVKLNLNFYSDPEAGASFYFLVESQVTSNIWIQKIDQCGYEPVPGRIHSGRSIPEYEYRK